MQYRSLGENAWVVSVTVAPGMRGHGYGGQLLRQGEAWLLERHEVRALKAFVHRRNVASQRLFESAGYVHEARDSGDFDLMVRRLQA